MQSMPDLSYLMKLARSDAGQQLLALLQRNGGDQLQSAIAQASGSNFDQAKQSLSALLSTPEAQTLLKRLEEEA